MYSAYKLNKQGDNIQPYILLSRFGTSLLFHIEFCYFLTCIHISQQAGQVVWYSHLFKNFPQFAVIHTVKVFGIVNKAEVDVFLELSYSFDDPVDVGNLNSGSSAFSKSSLNIKNFMLMYCWSLAWRFWALPWKHVRWVQLCGTLSILWHWLFFDIWIKIPFLVLWPLLSFPDLLPYWVQPFYSIIFLVLK